jgi:hypothetical protein
MKDNRTSPAPLADLDAATHFKPGSALRQFMAGHLGAPGCWPAGRYPKRGFAHVPDETRWINRWENEGGRTLATLPKDRAPLPHYFYPTRPLLTQLI